MNAPILPRPFVGPLRRLALLLCLAVLPLPRAAGAVDTDGDGLSDDWERGFGRYEIVPGTFTWEAARVDALNRGGHLATVINAQEWADMRAVLGASLAGKNLWLGGTDEGSEGNWRWITGEKWTFSNWRAGEPSNDSLGNGHGAPENYLLIWGNETATRDGDAAYWNDVPITGGVLARDGYILERGAWTDPNDPDTDHDGLSDGVEAPADSTYQVIYGSFTWFEAQADAQSLNGTLAIITSAAEWQKALQQAGGGTFTTNLWLGASDSLVEGRWQWVSGEPMTYAAWAPGYPNNLLDADQLLFDATRNGWRDAPGNNPAVRACYLLERPLLSRTDANNRDTDGDGLSDGEEVLQWHTDPSSVDTDQDGLSDSDELTLWHTDPTRADTDGDGLTDGREIFVVHTDPTRADTDGDTFTDGEEVAAGTDPLDSRSSPGAVLRQYPAVEIEFDTKPGESYQLQFLNAAGAWQAIGSLIVGTGNPRPILLSTRPATMRFYRVVLAP